MLSEIRGVPLLPGLSANDKVVHVVLYSVMGLLLGWGWIKSGRRHSHLLVLAFGIAYAAVDEFHQMFVPYRIPSVADWLADLLGLVLGYGAVLLAALPFATKERPAPEGP